MEESKYLFLNNDGGATMLKYTSITSVKCVICIFIMLPMISVAAPVSYNILDYGAKGDGVTLNTKSIQSAIDECSQRGGGTVYFPAGKYLSGTLFLKSYVTLSLEAGAVLTGSKDLSDYPVTISKIRSFTDNYTNKSLIYGEDLEHIAITGLGTIDGNGASFGSEDLAKKDLFASYKVRPYMIRIINCKNILVSDVTMLNSPMWVQHYLACESVNIDGITVKSRVNHNNDGIDIDGCNNVRISNCEIVSGDDAIVLKSTLEKPCQNITVTNCVISSNCNAFKLGTETNAGFQNITFSNSTIYDTKLAGIILQMVDGGTLTRVSVSNITMDDVATAIFIRLGDRARPFKENMDKPGMGSLSDVIISNIQASKVGNTGCAITGLPGYPVKNITLENIRLMYKGGGTLDLVNREIPELPEAYPEYPMFGKLPSYGFYCRHAENITFDNIELGFTDSDARPALVCDDINGIELYKIKAMFSGNEPLIRLKDVKNAFIQSCVAPQGIETFLQISGAKSEHITLSGNDLGGAKNVVKKDDKTDVYLETNRLK
jgi:polygalacturonase